MLKTEIDTDPLARGYSGMSDAEVAASLNTVDRPGDVPAKDVKRYLMMVGKWAKISDHTVNASDEADRQACIALIDALKEFDDFDLQDAAVKSVVEENLDALIPGYISADDKATILALENNRQSRAQELGLGRVTEYDVARVR